MRKIAFLLTFVLAIAAVVLAKDNQLGVNRTKTVKFAQEALVGGQVLPAGTYRVTHVMEGADHIMVFKGDTTQTRVKCNMVPLPEKSRFCASAFRRVSAARAAGNRTRNVLPLPGVLSSFSAP